MGIPAPPPRPCPVCRVAMRMTAPDDFTRGCDTLVCDNCSTKVLVHHESKAEE